LEHSHVTQTVTTEELRLQTLCNLNITISTLKRESLHSLFFYGIILW